MKTSGGTIHQNVYDVLISRVAKLHRYAQQDAAL